MRKDRILVCVIKRGESRRWRGREREGEGESWVHFRMRENN